MIRPISVGEWYVYIHPMINHLVASKTDMDGRTEGSSDGRSSNGRRASPLDTRTWKGPRSGPHTQNPNSETRNPKPET